MRNGAFHRVLDRHHPVVHPAARHLVKHIGKVRLRGIGDGVAEFLDRGLMGPGALRPQIGDFQIILEGQRGGHDFTVNRPDRALRHASLVHVHQFAQQRLLPLRRVDLQAVTFLDEPDLMHQLGAA